MNKMELIDKAAAKAGVSKKDAAKILDGFIESITETLAAGDKVTLVGFGTFETRKRPAREGRNPRTGAPVAIKARTAPAFAPGKSLKDAVSA